MGLFASSILVKYSLLNNSGSLVYAGTSSNSLRIWGAQLELAEYSQEILDNYINNYRYTRTTGQLNQNYYYLYNYRYGLEQNPDTLLIGSGIPGKVSGGLEPIPFWADKQPKRAVTTIQGNLLTYSEQFNNAITWVTSNATISSNVITAPNGTVTGSKLLLSNSSTTNHRVFTFVPAVTAQTLSFSIYARAAELSRMFLQLSNFIDSNYYAVFDLTTGAILTSTVVVNNVNPDWSGINAKIISAGNGWFRCSISANKLTTLNSSVITVDLVSSTSTRTESIWFTGFSPTVFNTQTVGGWGTFMNTYGVWIDNGLGGATAAPGQFVTYYRTFNAPVTGNYNISFAADDVGTISIDDSLLISLPLGNAPPYAYNLGAAPTITLFMTAGQHSIKMTCLNNLPETTWVNNPGGWAATITYTTSSTVLWDTRTFAAGEFYQDVNLRNSGIYVWGAQLETETYATDYVQTTSSVIYNQIKYVNDPDPAFVGTVKTQRVSGDPLENVSLQARTILKSTPTVSDDRRRIPSNPVFDATRVAGIELVKPSAQTFSYNRYTPVSGDNVYYNANDWFSMVGRSQRARMAIGNDTQVNFIDKRLDETKQIGRNVKFDALRVMGLEPVNKTSSTINLAKFTPLRSTDITYYKRYDWYSITPRSQYARLAYGIGDGSPYMFDNLQFDEDFTYGTIKGINDISLAGYGVDNQTSRLPGSAAPETFKFLLQQNVKRGVGSTIVINNRIFTTSDAVQTQELFYNKPDSPFGKQWYKLAPYYSQFSHILDGPGDLDSVHVGQYYAFSRQSGTDQERMSYVFIKGTFFDSTTMIDNMMILGENATYLQNKGLSESVGVGTPASILAPFARSVLTADQTHELFYNKPGSVYGKNWYLLAPRPSDYLSRYGRRLYNNPFENVKFTYLMTANRSGTSKVTRISITAPTPNQASNQINETFYNQPNNKFSKSWYQLAPYYAQSSWVYENDSDPFENVTVGSRVGFKASGDPYERVQFLIIPPRLLDTSTPQDARGNFVDKRLDEIKRIPQVAKFDALRVAGIEPVNKTSSIINLTRYTPLRSTDVTYYKRYDWYSITPRSQRAKQALGIGDGSPYIIDTFLFGDVFTYAESKSITDLPLLVGYSPVSFDGKPVLDYKLMVAGGPTPTRTETGRTVIATGTTASLRYDWGSGNILGSSYSDGVIIHFTGYILWPGTSGNSTVTFYARTDDGFYMTINNNVVIDSWLEQGPSNYNASGTTTLVSGQVYPVDIWNYENAGGAVCELFWNALGGISYIPEGQFANRSNYWSNQGRSTDSNENWNFVLNKSAKNSIGRTIVINNRHQSTTDAGFTMDAGKFRNKSWFQLAPLYTDYDHIIESAGSNDRVFVGDYYGGVRHSNNRQETMAMLLAQGARTEFITLTDTQTKYSIKSARNASYSSNLIKSVIRTNRILNSERLNKSSWITTGVTVTQSTTVLSNALPYRNVSYDAGQLHEFFVNKNFTYAPKKWYTIVPLATRTAFTSNNISVINQTTSNSQHGITTPVTYLDQLDNHFSYGMYVKNANGVSRVRLDVSDSSTGVQHYADFDLSSVTVLNRVNVSYANIISTGSGWFLIKIAGPLVGTAVLDTQLNTFDDSVNLLDTFEMTSVLFDLAPGDLLNLAGAVDLQNVSGIEELL